MKVSVLYESMELQVAHEGNLMGREERGQEGKEKIEKNEVMVGEGGRRRRV